MGVGSSVRAPITVPQTCSVACRIVSLACSVRHAPTNECTKIEKHLLQSNQLHGLKHKADIIRQQQTRREVDKVPLHATFQKESGFLQMRYALSTNWAGLHVPDTTIRMVPPPKMVENIPGG